MKISDPRGWACLFTLVLLPFAIVITVLRGLYFWLRPTIKVFVRGLLKALR